MYRLVDQGQGSLALWQVSNMWMNQSFRVLGGWIVLAVTVLVLSSSGNPGIAGISIVSAQALVRAVQAMCFEWVGL